jgi:SAM-dependent methyltransferase
MPPKPRSAEYFDGWFADRAATPAVDEIMNRHMGFPPGTRAGVVPAEAIPELAGELRLMPGSTLLDLACGRGAYGLLIAQRTGASLVGVDFSAQALAEAREQAARMGVSTASFRVGELTATGLPHASVEAVLCTDAIQFPDEPASAYAEVRRVLKPGGRVVLTCWEALDRDDERLAVRIRRAGLGAGLRQAGFTDVQVRDRPLWLAREHALWEETVTLDPGDDPALRSFHAEAVKSLPWTALLRRVLAVASNPQLPQLSQAVRREGLHRRSFVTKRVQHLTRSHIVRSKLTNNDFPRTEVRSLLTSKRGHITRTKPGVRGRRTTPFGSLIKDR